MVTLRPRFIPTWLSPFLLQNHCRVVLSKTLCESSSPVRSVAKNKENLGISSGAPSLDQQKEHNIERNEFWEAQKRQIGNYLFSDAHAGSLLRHESSTSTDCEERLRSQS